MGAAAGSRWWDSADCGAGNGKIVGCGREDGEGSRPEHAREEGDTVWGWDGVVLGIWGHRIQGMAFGATTGG